MSAEFLLITRYELATAVKRYCHAVNNAPVSRFLVAQYYWPWLARDLFLLNQGAGHDYLCKLFNKRNMKLAYCSTPNIQSILARHNQKVLRDFENQRLPPQNLCNCRDKANCPMDNKCLTDSIVYRADVTASGTRPSIKRYRITEITKWYNSPV